MADTIFSKIINGEIPSSKIYDDEKCIVILDIQPVNLGHALVIPKEPFANIYEIPSDLAGHIFVVAKKIAQAQKIGLGAEGVNIMMNNDEAAGQIVFHAHIHVIPRYRGDGFTHWHGEKGYAQGEAGEIAQRIKNAL